MDITIKELQTNGPDKLATRHKAQAHRFESLRTRVLKISGALNPQKVGKLRNLHQEKIVAVRAAEALRNETFSAEVMAGVGTAEWKAMWSAARKYSLGQAYKEEAYPNVASGVRCVLCAQELNEKAASRLTVLEEFVKGDLQRRAEELQAEITREIEALEGLPFELPADIDLFIEITDADESCASQTTTFFRSATALANGLIAGLKSDEAIQELQLLSDPPEKLYSLIEAANERAESFTRLSQSDERDAKKQEFEELDARNRLLQQWAALGIELERSRTYAVLTKAEASISTTGVSRLSSELTQKYVTQELCRRFNDEIRGLGLENLRVNLSGCGGRKGVTRHRLNLKATYNVSTAEVISDGEYRCLGLEFV